MSRVCIARVDRIGDLVLTLPLDQYWKKKFPQDTVEWLVPENIKFITEYSAPPVSAFFVKPQKGFRNEWRAMKTLVHEIESRRFDKVIAVHVPWWVAAAFWFAGVKERVGVASQWFSFLFFNRRIRQKRSQALKHESQYNLDLLLFAAGERVDSGGAAAGGLEPLELKPSPALVAKWSEILKRRQVRLEKFVIVHPGMGGSARNWPADNYKKLALALVEKGVSVIVTGSPMDTPFIAQTGIAGVPGVVSFADGGTSGADLIALLSLAGAVVVPSTGVAHLAASLGVPVAGIYSPVKVQAPLRWAPIGPVVQTFVPAVECPGTLECLGERCKVYDCMQQIPVESIVAYVMDKL